MLFTHHDHQIPVLQRCLTFPFDVWHHKNYMCQIHTRCVCVMHPCIFLCKSAWPCSISRVGGQYRSWVSVLKFPLIWDKVPFVVHCPVCQASWPSSFQGSPVPIYHLTTGAGITEVCYHAQLHLGSGRSNSGLHNCTEGIPPTEPPPWPWTVHACQCACLPSPESIRTHPRLRVLRRDWLLSLWGIANGLSGLHHLYVTAHPSDSKQREIRVRLVELLTVPRGPSLPALLCPCFPSRTGTLRASGEGK